MTFFYDNVIIEVLCVAIYYHLLYVFYVIVLCVVFDPQWTTNVFVFLIIHRCLLLLLLLRLLRPCILNDMLGFKSDSDGFEL